MEVYNRLKLVINEGAAEVKKQFVDTGKIPLATFNELKRQDPTKEKYKYLLWMVKRMIEEKPEMNRLVDLVTRFEEGCKLNLIKGEDSDIHKYKSLLELGAFLNSPGLAKKLLKKTPLDIEKAKANKGLQVVKETEDLIIFKVLDYVSWHDTVKYRLPEERAWCAASNPNTYSNYVTRGSQFYFVVDKKHNQWYAVDSKGGRKAEVWDENNLNPITSEELERRLEAN